MKYDVALLTVNACASAHAFTGYLHVQMTIASALRVPVMTKGAAQPGNLSTDPLVTLTLPMKRR